RTVTATNPSSVRVSLAAIRRRRAWIRRPGIASAVRLEPIPDAGHGGDAAAFPAELDAQSPHVHVDRARLDLLGVGVAPDASEELLTGEHASRGFHERVEEVELLGGEAERPRVHGRDVSGGIEGE